MSSSEIRSKFLEYFKKRGHAIVPSSLLIPDDPSVLLTTAGMQQFKKYYTGELDPMRDFNSTSTASAQKCFRTGDIDEVGDESHLTFFEMLGNFSFGGYFKEEAIQYGYEFITKEMGLEIEYVTVFNPELVEGSDWRKGVPRDDESREIWKKLGVAESRIKPEGTDVFWGPTGSEGPCGPTTEIYVKNASGNAVEIWNIVFNEFYRDKEFKLKKLDKPGIDTGMGLERLAMVVQKKKTIFETDLFSGVIGKLGNMMEAADRIIADHARGIVFLIADGVMPSNKDQGYILRRLMRRAMPHLREHQLFNEVKSGEAPREWVGGLDKVAGWVIDQYGEYSQYTYLLGKKESIMRMVRDEQERFNTVYEDGKKILEKIIQSIPQEGFRKISGKEIFDLITVHGFSLEWIKDIAKINAVDLDLNEFEALFKKHQEISRAGIEKKFGGHGLLLDTGELKAGSEEDLKKVTRLHTATHLMQQALRDVLGPEVQQKGSDITVDRTRFDFTFGRKMTDEEKKRAEEIVNQKIREDLPVSYRELPLEEAKKTGALHFFNAKYPERVKVYFVGPSLEAAYSKEFCGGPHVTHTGEIGKFRIIKEESSSAGVRRIRAAVD